MNTPNLQKDQNTQPEGQTREKILAAARAEFARHGPEGARVDRIAETAGVNKAMIYYYFSSKKSLYAAVFKEQFERITSGLRVRVSVPDATEARLHAAAGFWAQMFTESEEFRALAMRELANPTGELLDQLADLLRASGLPGLLQESFSKEMEAGNFRETDPRHALVSFLTLNLGYFFLYPMIDRVLRVEDHDRFVTERRKELVDLFLNGMKARPQ